MSSGWEWFVFGGTILSMLGCLWLIAYTNRQRASDKELAESESHVWDGDVRELNNPLPMWWLWLFILTVVFSAAYLAWYPGLALYDGYGNWTQEAQYEAEVAAAEEKYGPIFEKFGSMDVSELIKDEKALSIGRSLFANYCSQCHGSTAQGARGFPNLTDDHWAWGGDPAQIETSIMNGRNGIMPALGPVLGDDVDAMVAYVQGFADGQDTSSPAHQRYMTLCFACHGPDGGGNPMLGAPSLKNDVWVYGSSEAEIRRTITEGRNGVMPAHSNLIGPDRARILAAYVYSLSQP